MKPTTVKFKLPVRGVHIGPRCVDGSEFEHPDDVAHSHPRGCPPVGWICARTLSDLREQFVHEVAHLAVDAGHDDRWRRKVRQLGGRVAPAYRKHPRKEAR